MTTKRSIHHLSAEDAETIALEALAFLASDAARLSRFIGQTGITLEALHLNAQDRDVMVAALDHLLHDEPILLTFSAHSGHPAHAIERAFAALDGTAPEAHAS